MAKIKVFLDTDVVISSLLSEKGASYEVLKSKGFDKVISSHVQKELKDVSKRLGITKNLAKGIRVVKLGITKSILLKRYGGFIHDPEDAHIVFGTKKSKSKFLLTYNLRHYKINKIRNDLQIIVMTPGNFLQYLRSIGNN